MEQEGRLRLSVWQEVVEELSSQSPQLLVMTLPAHGHIRAVVREERGEIVTVSPSGGGTPGHGRVSVAALPVLHSAVGEGEHAGGPGPGGAGVGDSLAETEASQPHSVMAGSSSTEQNRLTLLERTPVVSYSQLLTRRSERPTHRLTQGESSSRADQGGERGAR